jgi:hypothetical protein
MRINRSVKFLTILATLGACSSPGNSAAAQPDAAPPVAVAQPAPAPVAAPEAPPAVSLNVRWDSGPLDRDYQRERSNLDAQHARERSAPRADETSSQRGVRQSRESKALEVRYTLGKKNHARGMPPQ